MDQVINVELNLTSYQIEMLKRALQQLPIDAGEVNDFQNLKCQLDGVTL